MTRGSTQGRALLGAIGAAAVLACGPNAPAGPKNPSGAQEGSAGAELEAPSAEVAEAAPDQAAPPRAAPPTRVAWREPTPEDAGACPEGAAEDRSIGIIVSPFRAVAGQEARVLAATLADEAPLAVRIEPAGGGAPLEMKVTHRPGVPAAAIASVTPTAPGKLQVIVGREGRGLRCQTITVHKQPGPKTSPQSAAGVWPVARAWDAAEEALYGAWLREMFHAGRDEELAFRRLDEVTALAERNLLHDALGWGEDDAGGDAGLRLKPDCADTPYFFRAYWSWKRRLPYAFRKCSRGSPGKAPRCGELLGNTKVYDGGDRQPGELGLVQKFRRRTLAWGVHTGNGRTALDDDASDLYPVRLDRRGLRPGTVYADPYGHILVLVELMDPEGDEPGVLFAVDGQPDGSITRKRFWEGNFLWNPDPGLGGSGFKQFRPVVATDGQLSQLGNAAIAEHPAYGDVWTEHAELPGVAFYDRMETLITPGIRDPFTALEEAVEALHESARVRVTSVQNGVDAFDKGGGLVAMPVGYKVFETTGPWENFSTPARDLRLLIAIDVVTGFAAKIRRQPAVFGIEEGAGQAAKIDATVAAVEARLQELVADPKFAFAYRRSDGSEWRLTLAELVARADALEMAYNPNDCPEVRWGASPGSDEARTCKRRASADQLARMKEYRVWFHERRRPPRGATGPGDDGG
ncbi:MAG: hypothetical protein R3A51_12700 [Nannocystaceae bacterium]